MAEKNRSWKRVIAGLLALTLVVGNVPANVGVGGLFGRTAIVASAASTTVTWNDSDITETGDRSCTKDGVTMNVTGDMWDFDDKNFTCGTFTSTVGNFTKIEVTALGLSNMGSGWTVSNHKATWTGTASSTVSFGGSGIMDGIWGMGDGVTIVFTVEAPTVNVSGVELNKTETTLTVNGNETLTATVSPDDAANKTVTWSSNNEAVATVDADGVVTAVSAGTANITATATNGTADTSDDKTATCAVTVNADVQTWTSGDCTVTLDNEGKLTVSKTEGKENGNMADYSSSSNRPWNNVREQITSVEIKDSVTNIGASAFLECSNLASVTIPNSVTNIGINAFLECSNLASVTIPESVTSIGDFAFFGCSDLASVTIPNSVTSIGGAAFASCTGLTSVTIPNSVTSIGNNAFNGCSGLTSITIPNSVTNIGNYAFAYCYGLTSVTIPDSVTSIGGAAFSGCSGL
ncbi:MAG: leucine-rich repeat protein, partial [Ruminococcus sp.]|nr:leucine-rich repeat protein [Ruminococcus sp.]